MTKETEITKANSTTGTTSAGTAPAGTAPASTAPAGSVLVIEDDEVLRETLVELLTEAGWIVAWAVDGEDALATFRADPADVILTDLIMPHRGGLELIKAVREFDFDTPIVVLTGYATYEHCLHALRAGANDFVTKPFESLDLLETLSEARALRRHAITHARSLHGIRHDFEAIPDHDTLQPETFAEWQRTVLQKIGGLCRLAGYGRRRLAIMRALEEAFRFLQPMIIKHRAPDDPLPSLTAQIDAACCVLRVVVPGAEISDDALETNLTDSRKTPRLDFVRSFSDEARILPRGDGMELVFFRPRTERPERRGA